MGSQRVRHDWPTFAYSLTHPPFKTTILKAYLGFPDDPDGKEFACSVWELGSIPGLGRSPGERNVYPLQYSVQNVYLPLETSDLIEILEYKSFISVYSRYPKENTVQIKKTITKET